MKRVEADVCVIGGGITAALVAEKLSELRPGARIVVIEAGRRFFDFEQRAERRQRWLRYGENPWPQDFISDQEAAGIVSRTMAVGGSALHWGGVTNRFSAEDLRLRSLYGLADDWPLSWEELERYYCEAERRIGVGGEPGPLPEDRRSEPYPMPAMPLSYNLRTLKAWAEKSGIPFWATPQAKNTRPYDGRSVCMRCNTCEICPTGARYSPDFTFSRLLEQGRIELHDRTLVRRLVIHDTRDAIVAAEAVQEERGAAATRYEARLFVLASGYAWSPHLLLLSATSRFANGLANRSGLVGRFMTGHPHVWAQLEMDARLYPGMNEQHSLVSRQFLRCPPETPYLRHDLRVWESPYGREPRLRDDAGRVLLGDALLDAWRGRARRGAARLRAYYDAHPDRDSTLRLDAGRKNRWGDPLPRIEHHLDAASRARDAESKARIRALFERIARADGGKVIATGESDYLDHPCGGCRMGDDPARSVCDSFGRSHDHENLFVVGSPTLPTGGCTNGTLTFVALALRSAERIAETLGSRAA